MKKFFVLTLCFLLLFTLFGCSNTSDPLPNNGISGNESDPNIVNGDNTNNTDKNTTNTDFNKEWETDGVLKILTIGNSFSNNTMEFAYDIAKSLGVEKIFLGNLYIGGCSLDKHFENAQNDSAAYTYYYNENGIWLHTDNYKLGDAIKSQNWDYISLQQASADSDKADSFGNLQNLINYVKQNANSDAKLIWNMTWAYDRSRNSRQMVMYKNIVENVKNVVVPTDAFSYIIPCGTALQSARTSFIGDKMTSDGMHLNSFGQYTAGLTLIHTLTKMPIDDISFSAGLNTDKKAIAIKAVKAAVEKPYEITELGE